MMKRRTLIFGGLVLGLVLGLLALAPSARADAPGEAQWQEVKAIIQERPKSETAEQHAQRLARLEAAEATAMAAAPLHPLRWDAAFFHALDVLLGPEPPSAAVVEKHLASLRAALKAEEASPEVKGLSSGLMVLTTDRAVLSLEAARVWLVQAQQHLNTYPKSAAPRAGSATTFDPQTLPMMNELIEAKILRYAAALKRSEDATAPGKGTPGAETGAGTESGSRK